jgi:hypothetical protein
VIGAAVMVARIATGEIEDRPPDDGKNQAAAALGETKRPKMTAKSRAKVPTVHESCRNLMELVAHYSYEGKPLTRLTNMTFWAGAGFSKAWQSTAPVGEQLFGFDQKLLGDIALSSTLSDIFGVEPLRGISHIQLRQIVYSLDMYEKYPDLRSRYLDDQNIRMFRAALRNAVWRNFDRISSLNYFDSAAEKFPLGKLSKDQIAIGTFFRYLLGRSSGSAGITEGLRFHFVTTNYDFVIETILDNCLGPDDSLLLYTYRGFTPSFIAAKRNPGVIHDHWLVHHLLKLNGGFEIVANDLNSYSLHYEKRPDEEIAENPPVLILPSREQDYSDPYFKTIFPKTVRLLRESAILVIVGYSLPQDDALIRFILRQFAEQQEDGLGKYIFYIDPLKDAVKERKLLEIYPWLDAPEAFPRVFLYQGGFAAFAKECLSLVPSGGLVGMI